MSKTVSTVIFHDQDVLAVLVVCAVSCGVIHYLHRVDVSCIVECRSLGYVLVLGMVQIFSFGCRCILVYLGR